MIPKVIHYCWFGRNPLPKSALKCIASWKKFFPDYEIKEWNEDNFDVNIIPYTQQAYEAKKYAFVSDYARFWILYHYGGVYFDTDVEVIKPMDDIIVNGAFMGRERGTGGMVNPGLGLGIEPLHCLFEEMLQNYSILSFKNEDGSLNTKTIVSYTTELLNNKGLIKDNSLQNIIDITIYPEEYFCPLDSTSGLLHLTKETVCIHWYNCSWINHYSPRFIIHLLKNSINRLFGIKIF